MCSEDSNESETAAETLVLAGGLRTGINCIWYGYYQDTTNSDLSLLAGY